MREKGLRLRLRQHREREYKNCVGNIYGVNDQRKVGVYDFTKAKGWPRKSTARWTEVCFSGGYIHIAGAWTRDPHALNRRPFLKELL